MPGVPSTATFCYCSFLTFYPKHTGCFSWWGLFLNHFCSLGPWNRARQREDAQYVWEGEGEGRRGGGRIKGKRHHHILSWSQAHTHAVTPNEIPTQIRHILEMHEHLSLRSLPPSPIPEQNEATGTHICSQAKASLPRRQCGDRGASV